MLQKKLKSLPQSLDETYTKIISRIDESHKRYALRVLQWLVYAKTPPSISQLVEVLAVNAQGKDERPWLDESKRFLNPHDILKICSALIETIADDYPGTEKVKLSHASVREYLVSKKFQTSFGDMMQSDYANAEIASVCLGYILELEHFETSAYSNTMKTSLPLISYAAKYWDHHARSSGEGTTIMHQLTVDLFVKRRKALANWIRLYDPRSLHPLSPNSNDALYYASFTGTEECVKLLLERGSSPNESASNGKLPLESAIQGGFENIVAILLQHGANSDLLSSDSFCIPMTSLQIAAQNGNISIIRLLLNAGADPNIFKRRPSPLELAIRMNRTEIAELLICYGKNPITLSAHRNYQYALQLLSKKNDLRLVRLLLEKGANPSEIAYGNDNPTPLEEALYNGNKHITKLLLDYGALKLGCNRIKIHDEIDDDDDDGCEKIKSHLETNSYNGNYDMVDCLLDTSLGSSEKYSDLHGVALWMAASQGHVPVVALLVDRCRVIPRSFAILARKWTPDTCQDQIFPLLDRG